MPAIIERLAGHHDRDGFDCREAALNTFLRQRSGQQQCQGFGKTYVAVHGDHRGVRFVTLSVGQIACAALPQGRKLPRHPAPVLRIGRLAVDRSQRGLGLGKQLLRFALQIALEFRTCDKISRSSPPLKRSTSRAGRSCSSILRGTREAASLSSASRHRSRGVRSHRPGRRAGNGLVARRASGLTRSGAR